MVNKIVFAVGSVGIGHATRSLPLIRELASCTGAEIKVIATGRPLALLRSELGELDNDTPVSAAWIVYTHNSPFAGIWGGATVEGHRGRGYYSALLHKRINDAKRRGVRYLIIDASPKSRPIVEKHGFTFVAHTTPYVYEKE